jgi:hypothetical protein
VVGRRAVAGTSTVGQVLVLFAGRRGGEAERRSLVPSELPLFSRHLVGRGADVVFRWPGVVMPDYSFSATVRYWYEIPAPGAAH